MKNRNIIASYEKQFRYYQSLAEGAMAQCQPDQLYHQFGEESNSIAIIVKHLHGNMLSRWTNFMTSDGEKPWRKRDEEFESPEQSKGLLKALSDEGWNCLLQALAELNDSDLERQVLIRDQVHSVLEAINRQLAHYAYHVGQIVWIARLHVKSDWQSLSIAKGASKQFNEAKFSKRIDSEHYTDEWVEGKN